MTEPRRFTEAREMCPLHGLDFVVYDINVGEWRCLGKGDHSKTAKGTLTKTMLEDFRRLGIEQEEGG